MTTPASSGTPSGALGTLGTMSGDDTVARASKHMFNVRSAESEVDATTLARSKGVYF